MAISKDDISTVLDHMVSVGYPDRDDGGDMDDVAEHIRNYVSANIDDLLEAISEDDEDMFGDKS